MTLNDFVSEMAISLKEEEERIYKEEASECFEDGRRATDEARRAAVERTIIRMLEDDESFMNECVDELFGY